MPQAHSRRIGQVLETSGVDIKNTQFIINVII